MKTIFAFTIAALSLSTAARAADIAALSCIATNGVTLKGEAAPGAPLKVTSTWGVYTKEFVATVAGTSTASKLSVNLASKDGPSYVLSLAAAAKVHSLDTATTTVSGTILQLSDDRSQQPAVVAYVRCDLRLR